MIDYSKKNWKITSEGRPVVSALRDHGLQVCVKCMKVKTDACMCRCYCKQCTSEANKKWREDNAEYNKERMAKWEKENSDTRKLRSRVENMAPEKRERKNFLIREWRKNNLEKSRTHDANKRAKRRQAEGTHTAKQWAALLNHFSGRCVYCGEKGDMTRDHIVPLARGGSNYIQNIVPACKSCNSSKNAKLLDEWRKG